MIKHFRPWGYYVVLLQGKGYKVKKLVVLPGKRTSLQKHEKRIERWDFLKGLAKVYFNEKDFLTYKQGETFFIPKNKIHRIENASKKENLVILELQKGICEETDIIRLEDDYNRT